MVQRTIRFAINMEFVRASPTGNGSDPTNLELRIRSSHG